MNGSRFAAPTLGAFAYKYLLTVLYEVIATQREYWEVDNERHASYSRLFADLAYCVLRYSESVEAGQARFNQIVETYFAELFATSIRSAFTIVDYNDIYDLLTGVKPCMLKAQFKADRWLPLLKKNRSLTLLQIVDNSPRLAESWKDIIDLTYGYPEYGPYLLTDAASGDSGAVNLILALILEPDFMFVDIYLVGFQGHLLMQYLQRYLYPQKMPYFLVTARASHEKDSELMQKLYHDAHEVIIKPCDPDEILDKVDQYMRSQGFIK